MKISTIKLMLKAKLISIQQKYCMLKTISQASFSSVRAWMTSYSCQCHRSIEGEQPTVYNKIKQDSGIKSNYVFFTQTRTFSSGILGVGIIILCWITSSMMP